VVEGVLKMLRVLAEAPGEPEAVEVRQVVAAAVSQAKVTQVAVALILLRDVHQEAEVAQVVLAAAETA
jgi:hypothetical protein